MVVLKKTPNVAVSAVLIVITAFAKMTCVDEVLGIGYFTHGLIV